MSPDDAPGASLLGLPRPVLASVLGRLPPADLARFQVACVGADDLEPGDLVEDASFEAVSAFAAERSLYPRCIARLPGESWRLCWAALSAVVHAISAEELYGRMGERYDARGTDLWYEDATEACTWLLFGAPEVPDAVTRSRARPLRRLVRAYVARILGGTLDPRVRAAALPRAMAAATRLADAGLHRLAGKILLGAAPTEDARGGIQPEPESEPEPEPEPEPETEPLPGFSARVAASSDAESRAAHAAAIEAKIAFSDIAVDTLYAQVYVRDDNARDSRDLANATTQSREAVEATQRVVMLRATSAEERGQFAWIEGVFEDDEASSRALELAANERERATEEERVGGASSRPVLAPRFDSDVARLAAALLAYARAAGLAAQHVGLEAMTPGEDRGTVLSPLRFWPPGRSADDANFFEALPPDFDLRPEHLALGSFFHKEPDALNLLDLFKRAHVAATRARRLRLALGDARGAAYAAAVRAEVVYCLASVVGQRERSYMFALLSQDEVSGESSVPPWMPKFRQICQASVSGFADAASELRGCGAGDSFEAAQAVKDLGKTLNAFKSYAAPPALLPTISAPVLDPAIAAKLRAALGDELGRLEATDAMFRLAARTCARRKGEGHPATDGMLLMVHRRMFEDGEMGTDEEIDALLRNLAEREREGGGEYERMRFGEASESDEASEIDEGYSETDEESEVYWWPESDDAFDDE
jgi:hypothetical protein